ncbi:MAG: alpha/beta fold hydrolase [Candidatus Rokuibacteriota bacterium]
MPTALLIVGERDHWCRKPAEFMARTIPSAELVVIPEAGHLPNLEQPAAFNDVVARFLAGLPG